MTRFDMNAGISQARRRRLGRFLLGGSLAAAAFAGATPALAQVAGTGSGTFGVTGIADAGSTTTVTIDPTKTEALVDWTSTDATTFLPDGSTLAFDSTGGQFTVLNRITPVGGTTNPLLIDGAVTATWANGAGNVWFYNPNGFTIGANSSFDVNGLVFTASPITTVDTVGETLFGSAGEIGFGQTLNPDAAIVFEQRVDSEIQLLRQNSYLAVVAPRIEQHAGINVNGSVAYVAAEAATINASAGLFDITVDVGTTDANGIVHDGYTYGDMPTAPGSAQYFVAVPKNDLLTMLVTGGVGYGEAAGVTVNDGRVVLSAGYNVTGGAVDTGSVTAGASIDFYGVDATSAIEAAASDTVTISDFGNVVSLLKPASFSAGSTLIFDLGYTTPAVGDNFVSSDLALNSDGGMFISLLNGASSDISELTAFATDFIDATVDEGASLFVADTLTLASLVDGAGATTGGDITLTVGDGSVDAFALNLVSLAYSDTSATGGTVTLQTTDANASVTTIDAANVWSLGFGNSGNTDGASGSGGTAQVLVGGGTLDFGLDTGELYALKVLADGGAGAAASATGASGTSSGGTAIVDVTAGSLRSDGIIVGASGLNYTLVFDALGDLVPDSRAQDGDGFASFGGDASVSISGGEITGVFGLSGADLLIAATGTGGDAFGSTTAGGTGGAGEGGSASFVQTGGSADFVALTVDVTGTGGNGSDTNVETGELLGDGGAGQGGSALVQLSGGTTVVSGFAPDAVSVLAEGYGGAGGLALSGTGGTGGAGRGGDAALVIDGGSLTSLDANGQPQPFGVLLSADGFGGIGGTAEPFVSATAGGTGGDGFGGDVVFDFSGGAMDAATLELRAVGTGGQGGVDGSGGESGLYAGADGGAGTGGTASFLVSADLDLTVLPQSVRIDTTAYGAGGEASDTGDGGNGGDAFAGDVILTVDGAALTTGSLSINVDARAGFGGDTFTAGATGGAGGIGEGGDISATVINGGSWADASLRTTLESWGYGGYGGNSANGTGGAGGDGIGGTITIGALGGDIAFAPIDILAVGYAAEGGFGSAGFGADGVATAGTIAISATEVGADIGSLQSADLSAYAYGALIESTVAGGTITLTDSTSGVVSFGNLYLDNGYDAGLLQGGITVTSTANPIEVANFADIYASGDLQILVGSGAGIDAGIFYAAANGEISIACLTALCGGAVGGSSSTFVETLGSITVDGAVIGSGGFTDVYVDGGDLVLNGATVTGDSTYIYTSGSILGTGTIFSNGDLFIDVGGSVVADALITNGLILNSFSSETSSSSAFGSGWYVSEMVNVGSIYVGGGDQLVEAGGDITIGDLDVNGNGFEAYAGGALSLGTVVNVSDLYGYGDGITFDSLTTTGLVSLYSFGDINGGTVSAGGDVSLAADGDLVASGVDSGGSIFLGANSITGLDMLSGPGVITVYSVESVDFASVSAGGDVNLYSYTGSLNVDDLDVGGLAYLGGTSVGVGSSGSLIVADVFASDGDVVITSVGDLTVDFARASGDIELTSTGGGVAVGSLYAGDIFVGEPLGSIGTLAVAIPSPGAGNIAINAAGDVDILDTVSAPEFVGVDAGGTISVLGIVTARQIYMSAADLVITQGGFIGDGALTEDIDFVATGDAALVTGGTGFVIDGFEITQIAGIGDFSLTAAGSLDVGGFTFFAGDGVIGDGGTLALGAGTDLSVLGNLLLDNAGAATLVLSAGGDILVNASTSSVRVQSGGVQAGSLFLFADRIIAGSAQTLSDISTLAFPDLDDALGVPVIGDGRSLIEGGSILVDAGSFYVANTGANDSYDARRGILANSMTVTHSGGTVPYIVINGVVGGQAGLDTAFVIGFPASGAPGSSVNGCEISLGGACGSTIDNEIVKNFIGQDPPHGVLDGEPRSTIETRIITLDTIEPEGFQPLIDEPVTGTGNDDLWEDGVLDGKQCPIDVRRDECEEQAGGE
ncbi:hypothetical protein [Croceicoccus bisphenolivorans]|uniref:hypothetical protein n=1 Tax=Croceicoccus bisphenolivorans TaxID=1783232 RepID=UPI000834941C|nr:hypothetical protein [Croceicoccus bisphenolivorans]